MLKYFCVELNKHFLINYFINQRKNNIVTVVYYIQLSFLIQSLENFLNNDFRITIKFLK